MIPQPSPSRARAIGRLVAIAFPLALAPSVWSQTTPRILHEGVTCMVSGQHLVLEALVEPADELVTVKAYFRAEIYPAFFYVEMARTGERYRGVLPRPTREVEAIVYYLEAVDSAFNSLRTEEFRPRVVLDANDCREDGPPATYLDGPASITVGATSAGSSFPPGFLTEGIVATISSAGRAVVGGGAGTGTFVAVGAAAGAAVGVGILASGDDSTTTVPPSGGITTTVSTSTTTAPPATTTAPGALDACFETQPSPPTIPVGGTVRFDASCSGPDRERIVTFFWTFGDGRDSREGRVVTRVYNTPGVFPAELTVTDTAGNQDRTSTDVRVEQVVSGPGPGGPGPGPTTTVPGSADLSLTLGGPGAIAVGATATYTVNFSNGGPNLDPTVTVVATFSASGAGGTPVLIGAPGCSSSSSPGSLTVVCPIGGLAPGAGGSRTISLQYPGPADTYFISASISGGTSDPAPGNNGGNLNTAASLRAGVALDVAFLSELQASAPGEIRASLELNRSESVPTDGSGPKRYVMKAEHGQNVLAGFAAGRSLDGALWRLDFSTAEGFVPGSLVVEAGDVVSTGGAHVVFRLGGGEARVRVRFRIE